MPVLQDAERSFEAVLFDWCGTLVEYPLDEDRFRTVLQQLRRPHDEDSVTELVSAFQEAKQHPTAVESNTRCDLSAEDHRATKLLICELAGIDKSLLSSLNAPSATSPPTPRIPKLSTSSQRLLPTV